MAAKPFQNIQVPGPHDWRTTDTDEINKRRLRARQESFRITNLDPRHPVFSNFKVRSGSGMTYHVEIRDLQPRRFACECVDFRINQLGTCKHIEAVLLLLESRHKRLFRTAAKTVSGRLDVIPDPDHDTLRLARVNGGPPAALRRWFDRSGMLRQGTAEEAMPALLRLQEGKRLDLRISQEVSPWLASRERARERMRLRREYEQKVQQGEWPAQETRVPLFPYQREGMLHLAFTERALLADEMGLGKTIQAIAACALLHRLGNAERVLVVTPASLKTEWEEQIQRFTGLPFQVVYGMGARRRQAYDNASFFTIVNYEQMLRDSLEVNERLRPDVVVLDEAQRIKNWSALTTQAVKRLRSRYAFVLTGTPIENRIDELHSLMDFLDPTVLGPLFRFNREFYQLDERGRPEAYVNLEQLHRRVAPYMIRRRKSDVETELPERTDQTHMVQLSPVQKDLYGSLEGVVARLVAISKRRPLTKAEQDKLLRHLNMMRMTCDTPFILDPNDTTCPKLAELEKILEECRANPDTKVIIFSEWERMLQLVRDLCRRLDLGFAWHTGTVPQRRRRAEINAFKQDPQCRVFLSTDSGSTGLNLQNASVVIHCDLPWNPAKFEQRTARAWRKHQTRCVTVIRLVSENTIEHGMLATLAQKAALSDGVLDLRGDLRQIPLRGGRQAFLTRLSQIMEAAPATAGVPKPPPLPADRSAAFAQRASDLLGNALATCDERYPDGQNHSVLYVVVQQEAEVWRKRLDPVHADLFGPDRSDPLAPTRLEVVDRATDAALQRLLDAGLIAKTTRAARPLHPAEAEVDGKPALTKAQASARASHCAEARRKLDMARLLAGGGFHDEARVACLEAVLETGRALAVEHRLPPPGRVEDALLPERAFTWHHQLAAIRQFAGDAQAPLPPAIDALVALLA